MKKTNVYFFHSVSCSLKSLITGFFLLVFTALAFHGSAQNYVPPTFTDVLPPLVTKARALEIAAQELAKQEAIIRTYPPNTSDPHDHALDPPRELYNGLNFIIVESAEPAFDLPQILGLLYGFMHTDNDGTTTRSYGFYTKSWNKYYTEIVNKLKR
jgi:hypothetical protein